MSREPSVGQHPDSHLVKTLGALISPSHLAGGGATA
jgi:hypothetical protein